MKNTFFTILISFSLISLPALAQETKTIILKDGTQIKGQIVGIDKGRYVIQSPTMGEIMIKEGNIANIVMPGNPAITPSASTSMPNINPANYNTSGRMKEVQNQIMSDPALMADIQTLAADPEIVALMSNPAFMQAAQSGNMQALQSSPEVMQMMQNPKIQALIQKIQAGQ